MSASDPKKPAAESGAAPVSAADGSEIPQSMKDKMAEALARKKAAVTGHGAHLDGHAKVGGATENQKATRTFRRKSGSA